MINGIQDVFYFVKDMGRSVDFYRAVFNRDPSSRTDHWTVFDLDGVRFALHWTGGADVPVLDGGAHGSPAGATVTLRVADIDATVAHLNALGVRWLADVQHNPWGSLATFADPDGNILKLMQPAGG